MAHVALKQFPGSSKENKLLHPNRNWMDKTCNNAEPMLMILKIKWNSSDINPEYGTDVLTQKCFVSSKKIKSGGKKSIKNSARYIRASVLYFFFFPFLFNIQYVFSLFLWGHFTVVLSKSGPGTQMKKSKKPNCLWGKFHNATMLLKNGKGKRMFGAGSTHVHSACQEERYCWWKGNESNSEVRKK